MSSILGKIAPSDAIIRSGRRVVSSFFRSHQSLTFPLVNCQRACKKCDEARPCSRCVKFNLDGSCKDSERKERTKGEFRMCRKSFRCFFMLLWAVVCHMRGGPFADLRFCCPRVGIKRGTYKRPSSTSDVRSDSDMFNDSASEQGQSSVCDAPHTQHHPAKSGKTILATAMIKSTLPSHAYRVHHSPQLAMAAEFEHVHRSVPTSGISMSTPLPAYPSLQQLQRTNARTSSFTPSSLPGTIYDLTGAQSTPPLSAGTERTSDWSRMHMLANICGSVLDEQQSDSKLPSAFVLPGVESPETGAFLEIASRSTSGSPKETLSVKRTPPIDALSANTSAESIATGVTELSGSTLLPFSIGGIASLIPQEPLSTPTYFDDLLSRPSSIASQTQMPAHLQTYHDHFSSFATQATSTEQTPSSLFAQSNIPSSSSFLGMDTYRPARLSHRNSADVSAGLGSYSSSLPLQFQTTSSSLPLSSSHFSSSLSALPPPPPGAAFRRAWDSGEGSFQEATALLNRYTEVGEEDADEAAKLDATAAYMSAVLKRSREPWSAF
ncbi:uncharacterized protein EV422DRAFT_519199 [Fimicolochytrium jonesii]|uniref:uncharacterized protein n=1 Tax=Fimicolochytrium jonesii TaxID=1396493 RepID=UPI0022FEED5A|nr:uncharacterized protein EV422DRAFT_519199 [Fimicolochytrium jonesii]KAI8824181.1 hypothetical protein EV422DRAFT_519199 [Fimicolochytrium jonesii]